MATLKCLACGQENKVGDESCAACASSLNLKLCSACEAVNASAAQRCHACGAEFGTPAAPAATIEESTVFFAEAVAHKSLPATRRLSDAPRAPSRRGRVVAWTFAIALAAGAGYAYYRYDLPGLPVAKDWIRSAVAPAPVPPKVIEVASPPAASSALQPLSESAPPPAPVQSPPKAAKSALVQAPRPAEAKRALSPITHTRGGTASAAAAVAAAPVAPAAATVAPAAVPAAPVAVPVAEPAPAVMRPARVTHTRAPDPGATPAAAVSAALVSQPQLDPVKNMPECPPGVAALGLCTTK